MPRKYRQGLIDKLALAVAEGRSVRAAARSIGMKESTAQAWAEDPSFEPRVTKIREAILMQAVGRLGKLSVKAAARLGELVASREEEIALRAALGTIDRLVSTREHLAKARPGAGSADVDELDRRAEEYTRGDRDRDRPAGEGPGDVPPPA